MKSFKNVIRPVPEQYGVGFASYERIPEYAASYREVQSGRYWNYFFTNTNQTFPKGEPICKEFVIDGFSPNLNKSLHVGHLRNLATARSLSALLSAHASCKPVSLLGASQGVLSTALTGYDNWCKFVGYSPTIYYDVLQPWDFVPVRLAEEKDAAAFPSDKPPTGCKVFDGPEGPVIVVRSDGRPTYGFYDLSFAASVKPTHYITGDEQTGHFKSLGLGEKHLPMGLVLGADGKKMKSRSGGSPSADEILGQIVCKLEETPNPKELAWNVLAWNFLHAARAHVVKYDLDKWTNPDQPGLYITYTYARLHSALNNEVAVCADLNEFDVSLLGFAAYCDYYERQCVDGMCVAQLANYAQALSQKLNLAYHKEKIRGGRPGFRYAVSKATEVLGRVLDLLGMFRLVKV